MPSARDIKAARERRRDEEEYKALLGEFAEDLFGADDHPQPEPHKFDPKKADDKQNFMLGLLGPATGATQEEQDAFEEQQALLQEQEVERDIQAGMYAGTELGLMTKAQRQELYRQSALVRQQARDDRDYEAKQKAKRREKAREERAQRWAEEDRLGL